MILKGISLNDKPITILPVIKTDKYINVENKDIEEWANRNPNIAPNPEDSLIEATENEGYKLEKEFISRDKF